ncbi:MAG TPA: PQQ-dependent dehydrogenase, methanol/ethanol family [Pararhizobium sp.]|nr:PQQ-dependent dehydrogenase, methanol/ethanol family [Pararhizobium sp.]
MRIAALLAFLFTLAGLMPAFAQSSPSQAGSSPPASQSNDQSKASSGTDENVTGATANFAPATDPGQWTRQARDYANTRYSPLKQINQKNIGRLKIAWTFSDGIPYGQEGAPLVIGDTMYLVSPFPDIAYALDLSKPGAPVKWTYNPAPSNVAPGKACCDPIIRGWAYADGKIIYNLLDDHTIAIDAKTGKEVWRIKMGNVENGETMTMSPFVIGDKVFVGNSGGEMGAIGWLAALDVKTGKQLWRAYSTGSDKLVKIGKDFKPYYDWMKGKDLGVKTWPKNAWKHGAGAPWGWISYDPKLNLIYYGTSNPGPRVPSQRPGLNLWTSTVFARDPDTGMAKWAYQFTPHDEWDYDGVNENVLIDLPFKGKTRHVLVHFDRNGYAYTIDRETGEVLVAAPFVHQTWTTGFDMKTGKPKVDPKQEPKIGKPLEVCPTDIGGKDWQPAAFSPRTGLLYVGTQNVCMKLTDKRATYIPGTPYDGMDMQRHVGPGGNWGAFIAWNPATGKIVWKIPEQFMTYSGALATGSDLVFYGTVDGWFRAVDAKTGKVLWSQKLSSGIISDPMTYVGPDGRQYVAVLSGVGGAAMVEKSQNGFPARGSTLYVFSIDGKSPGSGEKMLTTSAEAPATPTPSGHMGRR